MKSQASIPAAQASIPAAHNSESIQSVLIVGGGTSGWMSAVYLNRVFGKSVKITLVEASDIPTIGVGESTIPTLPHTLRFLGISETEFLNSCNASFKTGIKFVDWKVGPGGATEDRFWHPFYERPEQRCPVTEIPYFPILGEGLSSSDLWMKQVSEGKKPPFSYFSSPYPRLCDSQRFGDTSHLDHRMNYAYHLDAGLLGKLLKKKGKARGVDQVISTVVDVRKDDRGFISSVGLEDGRNIEADLFIDCSGFRGLLINQAMGVEFEDNSKFLPCDRAVALPAKSDPEKEGINPFTTATALSNGWSWNVPLQHRSGNGYVYCSDTQSPEDAEIELRTKLGDACSEESQANHIRMRVGRNVESWVKNCVSIGLSSSFIEPLEATAIFLVEYQLANLVSLFPAKDCLSANSKSFNERVNKMYDHIRDFIVMHYALTQREDTDFWKRVKNESVIPDSLGEFLECYRHGVLPSDALEFNLFRGRSFLCILDGLGRYPETYPQLADLVSPEAEKLYLSSIQEAGDRLMESLPSHHEYLFGLQKEASARGRSPEAPL